MEKFAPRHRLVDYGLFAFYSKRDIPKKNKIEDYKEFVIIAKKIWEIVAKRLINNVGGVVLDRFGYLCHWMTPKKKVYKVPRKGGVQLMPNYDTDGYFYHTALFSNIFSQDYLKGWSLDKSFNSNIKLGRFRKLGSGHKYKLYYYLIKRLYTKRFLDKIEKE